MSKLTPELEKDVDRLASLLSQLLAQHTQLLAALERKRDAMRAGDTDAMSALCRLESESIGRITEMEKQRLELVGAMTLRLNPDAAEPMKLRDLAEAMPEPARGRLLVARQQLVEKMEQVRHQTSVARRAAESLLKHMTGLVQTIGTLSTGLNTYGQRGQRPEAATTMRTLNVTA